MALHDVQLKHIFESEAPRQSLRGQPSACRMPRTIGCTFPSDPGESLGTMRPLRRNKACQKAADGSRWRRFSWSRLGA
jgi:hypothetical protein